MIEDLKMALTLFIVFAIVILLAIVPVIVADRLACINYQEITKRQTEYFICGGCYVNDGDTWLKMDEYKSVITAREGLQNR